MRPTTHELLESARHSLRDVVLPAVDDEWARYVAKCTDKLLAAVQVRLARELELLAIDTAETAELLARLEVPESPVLSQVHDLLTDPLPVEIRPEQAAGLAERVTAGNDAGRTRLVALVDALHDAQSGEEAAALPDDVRAGVEAAHEEVRALLRRQLARDSELMAPTFMAFGDPARAQEPPA